MGGQGGGSTCGARVPTPRRLDVRRFLICRKTMTGNSPAGKAESHQLSKGNQKGVTKRGQEGDPRETPLPSAALESDVGRQYARQRSVY